MQQVLQHYEAYRPMLFMLAYRMLGSVMDAEDIVQESFIAASRVDDARVDQMKSYLCKIVTNRCIDYLRSARKRRELYVGPWLPEPLVGAAIDADPAESANVKESVGTAFMILLEKLTASERAVFMLREVLSFEYGEIAGMIGKSEANCRQLLRRAKKRLEASRDDEGDELTQAAAKRVSGAGAEPGDKQAGNAAGAVAQRAVLERFVAALASGNVELLLQTIAEDALLVSDGGGKVSAAIRPIVGSAKIAAFFMGLLKKAAPDSRYELTMVNGSPGIITYVGGEVSSVISFDYADNRLSNVYIVVNPDKLRGANSNKKLWH